MECDSPGHSGAEGGQRRGGDGQVEPAFFYLCGSMCGRMLKTVSWTVNGVRTKLEKANVSNLLKE